MISKHQAAGSIILRVFLNVFGAQSLEDGFCQQGQIRIVNIGDYQRAATFQQRTVQKRVVLWNTHICRVLGGFSQARASCSSTQSEQSSGAQANGKNRAHAGHEHAGNGTAQGQSRAGTDSATDDAAHGFAYSVGLGVGRGQSGELRFTPFTAQKRDGLRRYRRGQEFLDRQFRTISVAKIPTTLCMAPPELVLVRSWDAKRSCGVSGTTASGQLIFYKMGEARGRRAAHMNRAPAWLGTKLGGNKRSMSGRVANGLRERHPVDVVISYPKML